MSRYPYYRRFHSDALRGMAKLTPEERGIYNTWLDLIYENGGPLAVATLRDWRDFASQHNCSVRKLKAVTETLAARNKLIVAGGFISNPRSTTELDKIGRPAPQDFRPPPEPDDAGEFSTLENDAKTDRKCSETDPKTARKFAENDGRPSVSNGHFKSSAESAAALHIPYPESRESSERLSASSPRAPPSPLTGGGARVARKRPPTSKPVRAPSENNEAFAARMRAFEERQPERADPAQAEGREA